MGKAQDVLVSLVRSCVTKAHPRAGRDGSEGGWLQQPRFSGAPGHGVEPAGPQPWAQPGCSPGDAQGHSV